MTAEEMLRQIVGETKSGFKRDFVWFSEAIVAMEAYATRGEERDATKELLADIISWEKDLSEYLSLETILKQRYIIRKRIKGESI